jgi:hypothetical protein
MTADPPAVTADTLHAALAAAAGSPGADEQRLAVAVLRLLSAGEPAGIAAAAATAGMPESAAVLAVRSWPAVFWDDHDQVVGFWGLALASMPPHRISRAGTELSAWCAWDPLFLALVIGDLRVTTADPVTGEAISYHIGSDGAITDASHSGSVLSFLRPDRQWDDDLITTFCHYVRHFNIPAKAVRSRWPRWLPGTRARARVAPGADLVLICAHSPGHLPAETARNSMSFIIFEGTSEIQRMIIGRAATGLDVR